MPLSDSEDGTSYELLGLRGKTMRHKKAQVAPKLDGPPVLEEAGAYFSEHSSRESLVSDLRSIVSAAHKLPAEVTPPARVWRSLRLAAGKGRRFQSFGGGETARAHAISKAQENWSKT